MIASLICLSKNDQPSESFGNKARGLWRLKQCEVYVPPTILVAAEYQLTASDLEWVSKNLGSVEKYIVRSSSDKEDTDVLSLAGVFHSEAAYLEEIVAVIERIRRHAAKSAVYSEGVKSIPVLIQPYLAGIGGVYLFDRQSGHDSLTLSTLGPSAVTSGATTPADQISTTSVEFQFVLRVCRELTQKLGGSADLELILNKGNCIFLQYRPLTRPLYFQLPNGLSSYFPSWLRPLCGSLWAEELSQVLDLSSVRYEDGFILGLGTSSSSLSNNSRIPSDDILADAEHFYNNYLFPKWNRDLDKLAIDINELSPAAAYREAKLAWSLFLNEYFTNQYESTVSLARAISPPGMGLSPNTQDRLRLFSRASQEIANSKNNTIQQESPLSLPCVVEYLNKYGFYLLEEHDFSQPTLAEQPDSLIALLSQAGMIDVPDYTEPNLLLKVAWLAEDDNEYKHHFSALLRQSIIRLGVEQTSKAILPNPDAIWDLYSSEVEEIIHGRVYDFARRSIFRLSNSIRSISSKGTFSAEILSPGEVRGLASRDTVDRNRILLRIVIETADYPLLMNAAGAVVSLGTPQSHGAIFARDIGKPLYRCPAIQTIPEETPISLFMNPPRVQIEETTHNGA